MQLCWPRIIVGFFLSLGLPLGFCGCEPPTEYETWIEYPDVKFLTKSGKIERMLSARPPANSPIVVQLADGTSKNINELSSAKLEEIYGPPRQVEFNELVTTYWELPEVSYLCENGKIWSVSVAGGQTGLKIAADKKGPFVTMPMKESQLIKIFGEPLARTKKPTVPPLR